MTLYVSASLSRNIPPLSSRPPLIGPVAASSAARACDMRSHLRYALLVLLAGLGEGGRVHLILQVDRQELLHRQRGGRRVLELGQPARRRSEW